MQRAVKDKRKTPRGRPNESKATGTSTELQYTVNFRELSLELKKLRDVVSPRLVTEHDRNYYRETVRKRARHPRHRGRLKAFTGRGYAVNPLCGDVVEITLKISGHEGKIVEVCHMSDGCAVCIASTELMIDAIEGKTIKEATQVFHTFQQMLSQSKHLSDQHPLKALSPLRNLPGRSKCASLGWKAFVDAAHSKTQGEELDNGSSQSSPEARSLTSTKKSSSR